MDKGILSLEKHLNEIMSAELEKDIPQIDCSTVIGCSEALLKMEPAEKYQYDDSIIMKTVNNVNRKRRTVKTAKIILVAALLAAVIAGCAFGYTSIKYNTTNIGDMTNILFSFTPRKRVTYLSVDYLPEGFELFERQEASMGFAYTFTNADDVVINIEKRVVDNLDVNTEYVGITTVEINGTEYLMYGEPVHGQGVTWAKDGYVYEVVSVLPKDELLIIAQGVS